MALACYATWIVSSGPAAVVVQGYADAGRRDVASKRDLRYPRVMTIDRGDYHFEDAQTWERSCRHIGLFLWWASERGLASEDHHPAVLRCGATEHIILQCDTKLWVEDLNDAGNAFAEAAYDSYLGAVTEYAGQLGVGDYDIPEAEATTTYFFAWLDRRLAEFTLTRPTDN